MVPGFAITAGPSERLIRDKWVQHAQPDLHVAAHVASSAGKEPMLPLMTPAGIKFGNPSGQELTSIWTFLTTKMRPRRRTTVVIGNKTMPIGKLMMLGCVGCKSLNYTVLEVVSGRVNPHSWATVNCRASPLPADSDLPLPLRCKRPMK